VEGWEQRAGFDIKGAAGDLLDSARDSEPVLLAGDKGLEDEQIQGSLKEGCWFRFQSFSPIEILQE
jgi:hypothetical protein